MTAGQRTILDGLARLLEYPGDDFPQRVDDCTGWVDAMHPSAGEPLRGFAKQTAGLSLEQMQEMFCRTFDIDPVCCLEVGWHIHGDNYDRGDFLVRMRQEMRRLGLEESSELPDHLTHVLPLMARLEENAAKDLAAKYVRPAVTKMLGGMAGRENAYELVVKAVAAVVEDAWWGGHSCLPCPDIPVRADVGGVGQECPTPADRNVCPTLTDRNVCPTLTDGNVCPTLTDKNVCPTNSTAPAADKNVYPTGGSSS